MFALAALVEGAARPDLAWRSVVTVLALVLVPALLWRRARPLGAVLVGWGVVGLLSVAQAATGVRDVGLVSMTVVLLLLFSLVRWGSGREVVLGAAFVMAVVVLGMVVGAAGWADVFGGTVLLMLVVALAAVFRYRADLVRRRLSEIRNEERVALAREPARHRGAPRLGDRGAGAGGSGGRRHAAGEGGRRAGRDRVRGVANAGRDAVHGAGPARGGLRGLRATAGRR